jgi:ribosomal protein S18 acetylase RimI-like enzyme
VTVHVGPARPQDLEAAVAVFGRGEAARRDAPVDPSELTAIAGRLADELSWPLVALDGDRVVGVVLGSDGRDDEGRGDVIPGLAHLSLVFVEVGRWGEGIGGSLVDAAVAEARRRGYRRVQLFTHEDNARAQRLYVSRGFSAEGHTRFDNRGAGVMRLCSRAV